MRRIQMLLLLSYFIPVVVSASAPTFCKCTCFTNSTIIQLGPHHDTPAANSPANGGAGKNGDVSTSSSSSSATDAATSTVSSSSQPSALSRSPGLEPADDDLEMSLDLASRAPSSSGPMNRRAASASCTQCNKAFCLKYMNLPICKGAEEKDVMTMCFQRDSRKDQIIVWGFILGTAGLLGWAAARRALEMREGAKFGRQQGLPGRGSERAVGGGGAGGAGAAGATGSGGLFRRMGSGSGGGERADGAGRGQYSSLGNLDGQAGRS